MTNTLIIRSLNKHCYDTTWQAMRTFTDQRVDNTMDELWLLEHPPVYTQGLAGKPEHILNAHDIPVIHTDRGGQVTYHGPGQLMAYTLFNIKRLAMGPRKFVITLEQTVIDLLAAFHIQAVGKRDAPGVYVGESKICSIGLRVRRGCTYHGIALNVEMDLSPFSGVNPCGHQGLQMTQLANLIEAGSQDLFEQVKSQIITTFVANFGYTHPRLTTETPKELTHGTRTTI